MELSKHWRCSMRKYCKKNGLQSMSEEEWKAHIEEWYKSREKKSEGRGARHAVMCSMNAYCRYYKIPKMSYEEYLPIFLKKRGYKSEREFIIEYSIKKNFIETSCWSCMWARLPWYYQEYSKKHNLSPSEMDEYQCFCCRSESECYHTIVEASQKGCALHSYRNNYFVYYGNKEALYDIQKEISYSVQAGEPKRINTESALKQIRIRSMEKEDTESDF